MGFTIDPKALTVQLQFTISSAAKSYDYNTCVHRSPFAIHNKMRTKNILLKTEIVSYWCG